MERKGAHLFVYLDAASDIAQGQGLQLAQPIMAAGRPLKHSLERSL